MIHIEYFTLNAFQTRCSIVWDETGNCAFVDPGAVSEAESDRLRSFVTANNLKPSCIMLTHCHFDHIYGVSDLVKTYDIPVMMHAEEEYTLQTTNPYACSMFGLPLPDTSSFVEPHVRLVSDGDIIEVENLRFEVIHTPGHTTGGVCYLERTEKILLSGDTIFAGSIGRTDHPGGDYDTLMKSIFERLMILDGDIAIIPGHGPESDIATERMTNPFLMPFNEPYEE